MNESKDKKTKRTKKKFSIDWALILGIIGTLSWSPFLFEKLAPNRIDGKLISVYGNSGKYKGDPSSFYLLKIGLISQNHDFNLKDIDLKFKFRNSGWKNATTQNHRFTAFTFEDGPQRLNVDSEEFLNNYVIFPKDEPVVGYLITSIPEILDEEIVEIELILKSFNGKTKKLVIDKSKMQEDKLLFDDSIWEPIDRIPGFIKKQ